MRKNMIFCMIGFALVLVTGGHAFAKTGDISMGVISIPLPSNGVDGKDGCTPDVTVTDKDANGCYTTTIQKKTLQSGSCVNDGNAIVRETCDGEDGAGGAVDVTKVYVPYPASTFGGAEPQNEGYIKVTIPAADEGDDDTILKYPDYCEEFYENGLTYKKCIAQDNAVGVSWPNADNTHNPYQQGDSYVFSVDELESGYPRYEYTAPRLSGGTSGYPVAAGFTQMVYVYDNGRRVTETGATDECKEYAKPNDRSARVTKCIVQSYQYPSNLLSTWVPGTTEYCLGNHQSDCGQYTLLVGTVDACAGLTSSDNAWTTTVSHSESEYIEHVYPVGGGTCTTNCTGTVGYKLTKETMCDGGNPRENKQNDNCSSATPPSNVVCATGYAYQTCTPVDSRGGSSSYSGCFPDPLNGLYAHKDEIVPADFAADSNYLYYCKVSNCNVAACWVDGTIGGTPYYNDGNGCWGRVSINGLQGADGKSCFVTNDGTNWNMCCSPSYAGNDCSIITDQDIINKLNGMMCQVNYTHKYLHDNNGGDPIANDTKAGAIGERVIVTNTCNSDAENLDSIYGTDGAPGNDYNPCDGLTAGSVAAQTTILNQTKVYRSREYSNNHYSPARGYYETTVTYCEGSATTYAPADECTPVADASLARSVTGQSCGDNQVLKRCMPQEGTQTPYFICDTTEASGYPKQKYFVPAESGNKFIKEGYTAWVHKYTDGGNEVPGELIDKDECRPVYKLERTASGNTVTATTSSVRKCTVQSYDYPTGLTWTVGATYCLNTTNNASTSCAGYSDSISDEITSTLKYHLPIMDTTNTTTPVAPGWTYTEEKDVNSVSLRGTDRDKDQCELLATRTTSGNTTSTTSVWRCTVGAPVGTSGLTTTYYAGATYCLNYANGTCPSSLTDIGAAIDDAADNDPCNGSTSATAVKKVVSRTYTRTTGSQGALTSVYKMCNDDDHAETTPDECYEIPTPAGETCTNGVWMQCKRQADEGTASATARGTTYGYCATYPQCVGNENSTTIVKKTERAYTAPTKTGTNSYYDTPGKMVTNKIPCSSSASAIVDSSEDDQCEEIPDTGSICPTNKVLKSCKRKGDESSTLKAESTYNLCATGASVFEAIEGNDPCGGDTTSDAAKKKVKNIEYEYVARNATGNTSKVGYSKKTTTMCNTAGNTTEYIYDTCVSVAAASGCNGTNDKNYKCYNQTQPTTASASAREYNTCNPSESAVALSSAVANKLDSDVTFAIKPNSQDSNKDYITITGSNITDKPVVALESLQGASVFDIWKEQFTSANGWTDDKCKLAFENDHTCSNLNESDFLASITAYGVWREEIIKNATSEDIEGYKEDSASLSQTAYQNSLKPCQQFGIAENPSYDGSQGEGKQYVMTCIE